MASRVGDLRALVVDCYFNPLLHAHASVEAIRSRIIREEAGFRFDDGRQPQLAADALRNGHWILLVMLQVAIDHFHQDDLRPAWDECARAFNEIWLSHQEPKGSG